VKEALGFANGFVPEYPSQVEGGSLYSGTEIEYHSTEEDAMAKFEIYKDKKGQFRWRLLANNNQVIATGEGYTSKAACKNGIKSVQQNAPKAEIDDQS
jgi:uncharacterized protein YegP (UPF0339 family)